MTTTIKIENLQPGEYSKGVKVVLKDQAGQVRQSTLIYPSQALHFNIWQGIEIELTEVPLESRI